MNRFTKVSASVGLIGLLMIGGYCAVYIHDLRTQLQRAQERAQEVQTRSERAIQIQREAFQTQKEAFDWQTQDFHLMRDLLFAVLQ